MTTREQLIIVTAKLIREKGINATGINEILQLTSLPKGSLYHHFPGGKDELVIAAIHHSKEYLSQRFKAALKGKSSADKGLEAIIDDYCLSLKQSSYSAGCPLATVALEVAGQNEAIRKACNDVLEYWLDSLESYFKYKKIDAGRKEALEFMTRLEGALIMAQIQQSDKVLKILKAQINEIISRC